MAGVHIAIRSTRRNDLHAIYILTGGHNTDGCPKSLPRPTLDARRHLGLVPASRVSVQLGYCGALRHVSAIRENAA